MADSAGLVVFLIILLIAVIGFLVYYFFIKKKNDIKPNTMPTNISSPAVPSSNVPSSNIAPIKPLPPKPLVKGPSEGPTMDMVAEDDDKIISSKVKSENQPYDTNKKISHDEQMRHFFHSFANFKNDKNKVVQELSKIDYERMNKGKIRDFLEKEGHYGFEDIDHIMDGVFKNYQKKKDIESIIAEYPHYRNMGWEEEDIRKHLREQGYADELIHEAAREYHQKNIYDNYVKELVKHMKQFVLAGKSDSEIKQTFKAHNWPDALIDESLEKCKVDLEKEHSVAFLQEEILKLLLEGDSKKHIAKVLSKQGWPEDELKKYYNDLEYGVSHLQNALKYVDLNDYNLDRIRQSLKQKHWPDEIIEMTIKGLINNVEYHKKLDNAKSEAYDLVARGFTSKQLKEKLISDGFDVKIAKKMIDLINKDLTAKGDTEGFKRFNSHVFVEDEWHKKLNEVTSGFETSNGSKYK